MVNGEALTVSDAAAQAGARSFAPPSAPWARASDAVSLQSPIHPREKMVRTAQLDAFVRQVPVTVLTQLIVAAVLVVMFQGTVDGRHLATWFGAAVILCSLR